MKASLPLLHVSTNIQIYIHVIFKNAQNTNCKYRFEKAGCAYVIVSTHFRRHSDRGVAVTLFLDDIFD